MVERDFSALRQPLDRMAKVVAHGVSPELLEELEKRFPGAFDVDPYKHARNAGQREVVEFLRDMKHYGENDDR